MVKISDYRSTQIEDHHGYLIESRISSVAGISSIAKNPDGFFISHKRVVVQLSGHEREQNLAIHLSPLGAMALVRRLVDILDECSREGVDVPNLHSDLAYKAANDIIDNIAIPNEDRDALESYAASALLDG